MRTPRILLSATLTVLLMSPAAIAHADEPTPDVPAATQSASPEPAKVETPAAPDPSDKPSTPTEEPSAEPSETAPPAPEPTTPVPANAKVKSAVVAAIAAPNSAPVAVDDHYTVAAGATLTIPAPGFLTNDSDPEGDTFTVDGITIFSHDATSSILSNGYLEYTPDPGFIGDDTASYNLIDEHGNTSTFGTITVTVTPNLAPVAVDDHYTVAAGATLTIPAPGFLTNDSDPEGDTFTVDGITIFSHDATSSILSNGYLEYTPDPGFIGDDTASYNLIDEHGNTSTFGTITVTVTPNLAPVAVDDDFYTVLTGDTLTVPAPGFLSNDSDPDGDPFSVDGITIFSHGTSTILANGYLSYAADDGFVGVDTATYNLVDDHGNHSAYATITVTVHGPNHAPVAVDDHYTVVAGETLTIPAPGTLANDTDADGDAVYVFDPSSFSHASSATISPFGPLTYTPEPGFTGDDTATYYAYDGYDVNPVPATITVTVTPAASPLSIVDDEYTVSQDGTLTVDAPGVLGNDVIPGGSSLGPCTDSAHGTATCHADGSFTFEPDAGFTGDATFAYTVDSPVEPAFVRAADLEPNQGLVTVHVTADQPSTPTDPAGTSDPATPSDDDATLPDTGAGLPPSFPVLGGMLILAGLVVLRRARRA